MAQPAPGWCERPLRKPSIQRFVSQTCIFDTKRTNDVFWVNLQTTPVPLYGTSPPDLRRGARKTSNLQGQAFQPAGSPDFPVLPGATGKSPQLADKNVCPTQAACGLAGQLRNSGLT